MKFFRSVLIAIVLAAMLAGFNALPARATHDGSDRGIALDLDRQLAYFASGDGSVAIIDISDPTHIALISNAIQTAGAVEDLFYDAATQRLFIADDAGGLVIWDVQYPAAPQEISVTPIIYGGVEAPARGVAVKGDHAYVSADWGYLHWLDVSDPAHPVDEGLNGQGGNPSRDLQLAADGYLFLAGPGTLRFRINDDGSLTKWGANQFANSYQVFGSGGYIYKSSGVHTLDILDANASGFPYVSNYDLANIKDIYVVGDVAYIANGTWGFRLLDVSDRENVQDLALEDSDGAAAVKVAEGRAYVQVASRLRIVDVTTPASPVVLGSFDANGVSCQGLITDVPGLNITSDTAGVVLSWQDTGATEFKVYRAANDPYFTPDDAVNLLVTITATTYRDVGALQAVDQNYSYKVRGADQCAPAAGYVERVGEFDFSLTPGSN